MQSWSVTHWWWDSSQEGSKGRNLVHLFASVHYISSQESHLLAKMSAAQEICSHTHTIFKSLMLVMGHPAQTLLQLRDGMHSQISSSRKEKQNLIKCRDTNTSSEHVCVWSLCEGWRKVGCEDVEDATSQQHSPMKRIGNVMKRRKTCGTTLSASRKQPLFRTPPSTL